MDDKWKVEKYTAARVEIVDAVCYRSADLYATLNRNAREI